MSAFWSRGLDRSAVDGSNDYAFEIHNGYFVVHWGKVLSGIFPMLGA